MLCEGFMWDEQFIHSQKGKKDEKDKGWKRIALERQWDCFFCCL